MQLEARMTDTQSPAVTAEGLRLRVFLLRRAGDGKGPPVLSDIERAAG
jgi:hypothetical protein